MIALGAIFFVHYEGWRVIDALQFLCATITTTGYGDKSPKTNIGYIVTSIIIIVGVTTLTKYASDILEYVLKRQHDRFLEDKIEDSLTNYQQILHDFDEDDDGKIDKFEYLSRMLILTNEVRLETIAKIMYKFDKIDIDKSGTIDVNDLIGSNYINYDENENGHSQLLQ